MKTNPLATRIAQTAAASVLLAILFGCETKHEASPQSVIPTGPTDGSAMLPSNSGPHQFPLTVHTDKEFFPDPKDPVKVYLREGKAIIIVSGKPQPDNSGPHQNPGGSN